MCAMRLAVTSDLHLPITHAATLADMAGAIATFAPDALVIGGDVAESLLDLESCLGLFRRRLSCPIWVLPGNHDLWARDAPSQRLWYEILPQTIRQAGCNWFEGSAFTHDDIAVAGTIAWYDYSGADSILDEAPATFAREKRYFNPDATKIDWGWTDLEFAALVAEPFLATLDRLESDAGIRQTIVVTHVPVLECQMCRRPEYRWAFSNAYFGNLTLGAKILERRKVTHILSGHTHVERQGTVELPDGRTVKAWTSASHYRKPAWVGLEL
jgi:hypothetical protein